MPLYEFQLEETNGEQQYNYDFLIRARNQEEADTIADTYARMFYGGYSHTDGYTHYFLHGAITIELSYYPRRVTKKAWMESMFQSKFLAMNLDDAREINRVNPIKQQNWDKPLGA
jgi:hypothetical protein